MFRYHGQEESFLLFPLILIVAAAVETILLGSLPIRRSFRSLRTRTTCRALTFAATDSGSLPWTGTRERATSFEYDLPSGKRLRAVEVQSGSMFHPGGLQLEAKLPLAPGG